MAGTSRATPRTFPVIFHVYDASTYNHHFRAFGGFYRSSIEVHGVEYMFLDCFNNNGIVAPRVLIDNPSRYTTIDKGLKLYQSIVVGRTHRSGDEADEAIRGLPLLNAYNHEGNNSHRYAERVWQILVGNTNGIQRLQWVARCDLFENDFWFLKVKVWAYMVNVNPEALATFPVVLHVYKLPSGTTRRCFGFTLCLYRSSVEVHGVEYMYCEHDGVTGIVACTPRHMVDVKGLVFVKSIVMGRTGMQDAAQVNGVVEGVGKDGAYGVYHRNVYNYITHNCHHFSDDLCDALVRKRIPDWIKRATFYERNYTGEALTTREKHGRQNPVRWSDGSLIMIPNDDPPMDSWLVRTLNRLNTNNDGVVV